MQPIKEEIREKRLERSRQTISNVLGSWGDQTEKMTEDLLVEIMDKVEVNLKKVSAHVMHTQNKVNWLNDIVAQQN